MRIPDFLLMVVIAGVFGFIATQLMGARRVNLLMMIVLGFVGAIVGRFAAQFFHLPNILPINIGNSSFPLVWSILGCLLVVAIFSAISQQST